ncbi:Thioredoxin 1 [Buchnera aphidicola (Anoecia corni)]|uniref:Thioredoxin n=1 Tax=Buchnera aphidicola (Anoecia corni) TaxID=2994477 RepID=A0AAT9IGY4_9GAMM
MKTKYVNPVTDNNFKEKILEYKGFSLVDFWANWCHPCKLLAPVLEEVAKEYESKLLFWSINVEHNSVTSNKYSIKGIPTLLLFKNGEVSASKVGFVSKQELTIFLDEHLK